MSINSFPQSAAGGLKSVQRGEALASGNITITSVDTTKTFVRSFSTSSSGAVALSGDESGTLTPSGGEVAAQSNATTTAAGTKPDYIGTRTLSGGTTDLTTKLFGVYLLNATTLTATGPCRYEVVEFL